VPDSTDGREKAARLLVALGPEAAGEVLAGMSESEISAMVVEMGRIGFLPAEEREGVLADFCETMSSASRGSAGGSRFAMAALRRALGEERAAFLTQGAGDAGRPRGFSLLRDADPGQVLSFIQQEHPQTMAVILSNLDAQQAGELLAALPEDMQVAVASRMATLDQVPPDMLAEIETALENQLSALLGPASGESGGGVQAVAEILNMIDRSVGRKIMDQLLDQDPELAERVKRLMFTFDDLAKLDDRSVREVIKEIDTKELALAFKACSEEVKERVFSNLSQRAGDMIREEIEYMGPVRLRDVQEAQQRIIDVVMHLEEDGTVVIAGRGGEDQIIA